MTGMLLPAKRIREKGFKQRDAGIQQGLQLSFNRLDGHGLDSRLQLESRPLMIAVTATWIGTRT
jgi:hypothetical protein